MKNKYKIDEEAKRIDMFDERWYQVQTVDGEVNLRSVTTFLEAYPKGYGFNEYLKKMGFDSEIALKQAGDFGSAFHYLIEQYLKGNEVKFEDGEINLWERFLLWHEWFEATPINYKPDMIEKILYCLELQTAGTIDLIANEDGQAVIYDWKTGNYTYHSYDLQLSVYSYFVKKHFNLDYYPKAYLGWFPHKSKAPNNKGFRIIEVKNIEYNLDIFRATQTLYLDSNPNEKPKYKSYPLTLKREVKNAG